MDKQRTRPPPNRRIPGGAPRPEDDEKIAQRSITLSEAKKWIRSGKIRDSKTISGILYYDSFIAAKR